MLMLWDIKEEYAHIDFYCEASNVGLYDYLVWFCSVPRKN